MTASISDSMFMSFLPMKNSSRNRTMSGCVGGAEGERHDRSARRSDFGGTGMTTRTLRIDFNVRALEPVILHGPSILSERDLMSPYVWAEPDGRYGIMVRAVPPAGVD